MDYSVRDSSILQDMDSISALRTKDTCIRMGIVREERQLKDDSTRYIVEVFVDGRQVPVSCIPLTRFGGAHNFEEVRLRPWLKVKSGTLPPGTADKYALRSGDTVVVAFINGSAKEGIILGGVRHGSRPESTTPGNIQYHSRFNGIETQISSDGSYKVLFNGLPVNDALLNIPSGTQVPPPVFNPFIAGSFFGFDANGNYVVSDGGDSYMKIWKTATDRALIAVSGGNKLELGGNFVKSVTSLKTDEMVLEASLNASMKANAKVTIQGFDTSIKTMKLAIGNDQFELIDGLIKLIDAMGSLVITSPSGTCLPFATAPQWSVKVLPIKIALQLIKGTIQEAKTTSFSGDDSSDIGGDIG